MLPSTQSNKKGRNLIVCGLPQSIGRDDIHRMFSEVGPVVSTKIMLDVKTGGHRGFGFVLFEHDADAARAKNTLHGLLIDPTPGAGKSGRMRVDFANHDAFNVVTDTTHIFVRNVPPGTTNLDVVTYFTQFGEVVSCSLRKETTRPGEPPTMAAFVEFADVPSAKEAATKGSGATPFEDKSVPLLVKLAETNDVRAERRLRQQQAGASDPSADPSWGTHHRPVGPVSPPFVVHGEHQGFPVPKPQAQQQVMALSPQQWQMMLPEQQYNPQLQGSSVIDVHTGRVLFVPPQSQHSFSDTQNPQHAYFQSQPHNPAVFPYVPPAQPASELQLVTLGQNAPTQGPHVMTLQPSPYAGNGGVSSQASLPQPWQPFGHQPMLFGPPS